MDKGMFIPDLQPWDPPLLHVRMFAIGHVNAPPPAQTPLVLIVEELQPVQVMQIPANRTELAVDFKCVESFMSPRISSSLKCREGTVSEACQERARILNPHRFFLSRQAMLASLNERLCHGGDFVHWSVQPNSCIDVVCQQISRYTASRHTHVQPP